MTPENEKQISRLAGIEIHEMPIRLTLTKDSRSSEFRKLCDRLSSLVPSIRIIKDKEETGLPTIQVGQRFKYNALPIGAELEPFLEILEGKHGTLPKSVESYLNKIDAPVNLKLYISQHCKFCPAVVRQLIPLILSSEWIRISIIDGMLFPEIANADDILSVPTLIFDNFRWTGTLGLQEVLKVIVERDPAALSAESLKSMIEDGNALKLAQLMIEKHMIFPAMAELITHPLLNIRLGAMVAIEQVADENPQVAMSILDPLWEHFENLDDIIKGDVIYIMGITGDNNIIQRLKSISDKTNNPEIKDAVSEAIENILNRIKM